VIELESPEVRPAASAPSATAPLEGVAVRWRPVVGREERPIGFRLALCGQAPGCSLAALLDAVLAGFRDGASGMPHGLILLAPRDRAPDDSLGFWGAPRNVLLELDAGMIDAAEGRERVAQAQKHGVRLALGTSVGRTPPVERLASFQYLIGPASGLASTRQLPREIALLATDTGTRAAVDAAFAAGASGVIGWPTAPLADAGELKPQQRALLNLIRLVQSDADTGDIEKDFKRDPMLAYMLLTLANSPAFMRSSPIASLSHAIQLLGYQRLVKWLVLLLVIASKESKALPAIYSAVLRGLLLENCATAAGASHTVRDQCFVVGAFSLLDRITGRSLAKLTDDVPLPDAVSAALNGAGGPYAAWLDLARAVEDDDAADGAQRVAAAAAPLKLTLGAVNAALLKALATNDALQTLV
jgi:EAL and modified HD-GYP domain-containing signal transduction protein